MMCQKCNGQGKTVTLLMSDAALMKISQLAKLLPDEPVPVAETACRWCSGRGNRKAAN